MVAVDAVVNVEVTGTFISTADNKHVAKEAIIKYITMRFGMDEEHVRREIKVMGLRRVNDTYVAKAHVGQHVTAYGDRVVI